MPTSRTVIPESASKLRAQLRTDRDLDSRLVDIGYKGNGLAMHHFSLLQPSNLG